MAERRNLMVEAAEKILSGIFDTSCRALEKEYQNRELRKAVLQVFSELFLKTAQSEKEAAWLGICYLHTSQAAGSYELLISVYDKYFYLDSKSAEVYWRPPHFFERFEDDIKVLITELSKSFPRIQKYEENAVRSVCLEYYYAALFKLFINLSEDIFTSESFKTMKIEKDFAVFWGKYQGEGKIFYHIGEKENKVFSGACSEAIG